VPAAPVMRRHHTDPNAARDLAPATPLLAGSLNIARGTGSDRAGYPVKRRSPTLSALTKKLSNPSMVRIVRVVEVKSKIVMPGVTEVVDVWRSHPPHLFDRVLPDSVDFQ
jgi:hypothetical protein